MHVGVRRIDREWNPVGDMRTLATILRILRKGTSPVPTSI